MYLLIQPPHLTTHPNFTVVGKSGCVLEAYCMCPYGAYWCCPQNFWIRPCMGGFRIYAL